MKKILLSLLLISSVAILSLAASGAFFSDTERSTGNVFQAGAIDLKVDSECTYNGAPSSQCGTWLLKDLEPTIDKFFNFIDIKPGDWGENTISLHVYNNDAWVCAEVSGLANLDNTQTEPESLVDTNGLVTGELQDALEMTIWRDLDCDNILDSGESILVTGHPVNGVLPVYDSNTGTGALPGNTTACLGVSWNLPPETGNEVQTDSLTGNISFYVEQARNNGEFVCTASEPSEPNGDGNDEEENGVEEMTISLNDYQADPQYGYTHNYSGATVGFTYDTPADDVLTGTITATGLKPYATYQLKFEGKPTCNYGPSGDDISNEYIGYLGRWWNNTTSSNTNDAGYESDSDYKGGAHCITGYLVWDFFTADSSGNASEVVQTDSSYHVLRAGGGVCNTIDDSHLAHLDAAHPTIWFSPADKVNGEIERGTCGGTTLNAGDYTLGLVLTEESFHQSPGTWTTVMGGDIEFSIN